MSSSSAPPKGTQIEPGFRLDRYELLCVLAQGGMASVWLARMQGKHGFEKLVAVKTILPAYAAEAQFQEMFLDEARIASGIEHPNVAKILDLGEYADVLYLVMELVDGDPLQRLARECEKKQIKIPLGVTLKLMSDVCAGLEAAHSLTNAGGNLLGIVHRDISPQNILVTTGGVAKVIDFGIAKARHRATAETSAGTLKGKINYMAPEQARGTEVDRRADLWAVGAVMYYLMTGAPPYQGANQLATLHALVNGDAIAPLPSTVPLPVRTVVLRALQADVARRFESALEMQIAIDKAIAASRLQVSTGEIAQFQKALLGPRAEQRKKQIERAISEAHHREKVKPELTDPRDVDTGSVPRLSQGTQLGIGPQGAQGAPVAPASQPSFPNISPMPMSAPEPITGSLGTVETPSQPVRGRRVWPLALAAAASVGILATGVGLYVVRHAAPDGAAKPAPPAAAPAATEAQTPPTSSTSDDTVAAADTAAPATPAAPATASASAKAKPQPPWLVAAPGKKPGPAPATPTATAAPATATATAPATAPATATVKKEDYGF